MWKLARLNSIKTGIRIPSISHRTPTLIRSYSSGSNELSKFLTETIKATGPIPLGAFMRQCLTNPSAGYYINKDPFGKSGDFITSPEISQMFGELVGVWVLTQWMAQNQPSEFRLVEFGPGRGTLMDDLLRSTRKFAKFDKALKEIYMIEASPTLKETQWSKLCEDEMSETEIGFRSTTRWGTPIYWRENAKEIPDDNIPTFIIAHEFYDALPIYQFEHTKDGWRELLVNSGPPPDNSLLPGTTVLKGTSMENSSLVKKDTEEFHLSIAPSWTPSSKVVPQTHKRYSELPVGSKIEICPEGWEVSSQISSIIGRNGGAAFIVDYGPSDTIPVNTLRGIKDHKLVSPFTAPGKADLSADVDFQAIKVAAEATGGVDVHGPVEQGDWLHSMGIGARASILASKAKDEKAKKRVESEYRRLVEKSGGAMGKIYKVMAIVPEKSPQPVGFGGSVNE